jgi:hypothetical protein
MESLIDVGDHKQCLEITDSKINFIFGFYWC